MRHDVGRPEAEVWDWHYLEEECDHQGKEQHAHHAHSGVTWQRHRPVIHHSSTAVCTRREGNESDDVKHFRRVTVQDVQIHVYMSVDIRYCCVM